MRSANPSSVCRLIEPRHRQADWLAKALDDGGREALRPKNISDLSSLIVSFNDSCLSPSLLNSVCK